MSLADLMKWHRKQEERRKYKRNRAAIIERGKQHYWLNAAETKKQKRDKYHANIEKSRAAGREQYQKRKRKLGPTAWSDECRERRRKAKCRFMQELARRYPSITSAETIYEGIEL